MAWRLLGWAAAVAAAVVVLMLASIDLAKVLFGEAGAIVATSAWVFLIIAVMMLLSYHIVKRGA